MSSYSFRINDITFNDGTTIKPQRLTVLIGPNNSGKSRALKDIHRQTTSRVMQATVVRNVNFTLPPSFQDLEASYPFPITADAGGNFALRGLNADYSEAHSANVGSSVVAWKQQWTEWMSRVQTQADINSEFRHTFGNLFVGILNTDRRLLATNEAETAAPEQGTPHLLQALYQSAEEERRLRQIILSDFGLQIALDYSELRRLCLRVATSIGAVPTDPRAQAKVLKEYRNSTRKVTAYEVTSRLLLLSSLSAGHSCSSMSPKRFYIHRKR